MYTSNTNHVNPAVCTVNIIYPESKHVCYNKTMHLVSFTWEKSCIQTHKCLPSVWCAKDWFECIISQCWKIFGWNILLLKVLRGIKIKIIAFIQQEVNKSGCKDMYNLIKKKKMHIHIYKCCSSEHYIH